MSVYHVFAYFFILAGGKIILAGRWENDFGRAVDKIILVGGKIILEGGKIVLTGGKIILAGQLMKLF